MADEADRARTGSEQPKLNDLSNYTPGPKEDDIWGDWAHRPSKDIVLKKIGNSLLTLCFMLDCVILNNCCNGDRRGEYIYLSPHGSSVTDYFPMSEDLFSANCNLHVGDRIDSWHMPVGLRWTDVVHNIEKPVATESREKRIAW